MLVSRVKKNLIAFLNRARGASSRWRSHFPLMLLLLVFICNTSLWAAVTNIGYPPDELSHFDYTRHLAINHTLPIYGQTTYIHRPGLQAHASLPPLYYLLGTPVQMVVRNASVPQQMLALRAISILLGAITVALAYKFGRMLVPSRPEFAFAVAALVGFNPMFTFLSAAINSDNLINLIYAALLVVLTHGLRRGQPSRRWFIGLGAILGAGLITKQSIVMGVLVSAGVLLVLAWKQRPRFLPALARYGLWVITPVFLISGWYFLRNWNLYGNPTGILAGSRQDIYAGRPYQNVGSIWEMILATKSGLPHFRQTLFLGFWGVFDHYEILMPLRVYKVMALLLVGGLAGVALWIIGSWTSRQDPLVRLRLMLALIGGSILILGIAGVANFSYRIDYQPQGRYIFGALVPVAVAIVGGWEKLASLLRLKHLVAPLIVVLILTVNLIGLLLALAPAHHNRYLKSFLQNEAILQRVYAGAPAQTSFVAQQPEIQHLDVLLNIPKGLRGPLIWRIVQPDTPGDSLTAIVQQPAPGVGRYTIEVPLHRFSVGRNYILKLEAPATTAQSPVLTPFSGNEMSGNPSAADLGLQVVYPKSLNKPTLLRADYMLRSGAPGSFRGRLQRILYPLDAILLFALAIAALAPLLSRPRVVMILLPVMGLTIAVLLPKLRPIPVILPAYKITAVRGLGPDPEKKSAAGYSGSLEVADFNAIGGWAWNARQPNSPINFDIYDGGAVVATLPTIMLRSGLVNATIGNGYHGFTNTLDRRIKNRQPHSISARIARTNIEFSETPKSITCSAEGP